MWLWLLSQSKFFGQLSHWIDPHVTEALIAWCLSLSRWLPTTDNRYPSVTVAVKGWGLHWSVESYPALQCRTVSGLHPWARDLAVLVVAEQTWVPAAMSSSSWHTTRALEHFSSMGKTRTHPSLSNRFGEPSGNRYLLKSELMPRRFQQQGGAASPAQCGSGWLVVSVGSLCLPVAGKLYGWGLALSIPPSNSTCPLLFSQLVSKMLTLLQQII